MMRYFKLLKRVFFIGLAFLILSIFSIYFSNKAVENHAVGKLFSQIDSIPFNKVGLVLGTSKYLVNGNLNPYYIYRIDAAVRLYKAGKIKYIIVSGDNHTKGYDEPTDMRNSLMEEGIPAEKIYLDYAGFRTLDSVVRAKEVFQQENITFISQKFHNERALYLANKKGINAVGYNAKDVSKSFGKTINQREYLARVKMMLDLLLRKDPRFLGEEVNIP